MVVDGTVLIGNEDGNLTLLKAGGDKAEVIGEFETENYASIYSTPTIVGEIMYLTDRNRMYAIKIK